MIGGGNIPGDYDQLEATKECEYKQGYLGYVEKIELPQLKNSEGSTVQGKNPVLTARAVFAVLNKNSLSLFDKEHVNSLVKTVDIVHLKPSYYPT